MTPRTSVERSIGAWLDATGPARVPDRVVEAALSESSRQRQRRVWLPVVARDFPAQSPLRLVRVPAPGLLFVIVILALAAAGALAAGAFRRPLPSPFGLAGNGAIAFDAGGRILRQRADGSERSVVGGGSRPSTWPSFSPDGSHIGYWLRSSAGLSIVIADADGARGRTVDVPTAWLDGPRSLNWAPDSRLIAIDTNVGIATLDAATGAFTQLHVGGPDARPVWSSEGMQIAYLGEEASVSAVRVVNADGTGDRVVGSTPDKSAIGGVAWEPGGDRLAFFAGPINQDVYVLDLPTGEVRNISNDPRDDFTAAWSPDGARLAYLREVRPGPVPQQGYKVVIIAGMAGRGGAALNIDPTARAALPATAVLDGAQLAWSPDGRELAAFVFDAATAGNGDSRVLVFDADTGAPIAILGSEGNVGALSWQRVAP